MFVRLAIAAYCLSFCLSALAGGPLVFNSAGPIGWDTSSPIPYRLDKGPFRDLTPVIDSATVVAKLDDAFGFWSSVATASIKFENKGFLPQDVSTAQQFLNLRADSASGNWVVLDQRGKITDGVFGVGNSNSVLGFATPIRNGNRIVRFYSVMNGKLASSAQQFMPTFVHEFGHAVGLDHSQIQWALANDGDDANDNGVPIMFPTSTDSEDLDPPPARPLHVDDEAWISHIYKAAHFGANYGSIKGRIVRADNSAAVLGANVIAVDVSDGHTKRYSCVSDYLKKGDGSFEIPLRPGKYTLFVEPIRPGFDAGSSVGPYSEESDSESFVTRVKPKKFTQEISVVAGSSADGGILKVDIQP